MGKLKGFIKKTTVPSLICYCIAVNLLPVFIYALLTLQIFGLLRILFCIALFLFIGNRIQKSNNAEEEKYSIKRTIIIIACIAFFIISISFIFGKSGNDELKSDDKKSSKLQRSVTTTVEETTTEALSKKVTEKVTEKVTKITTTLITEPSVTTIERAELMDLYNSISEYSSYSEILYAVQATGLPYNEIKYLGAYEIKVAYTSGATMEKHADKGDCISIYFKPVVSDKYSDDPNDYPCTSIKYNAEEMKKSVSKVAIITEPVTDPAAEPVPDAEPVQEPANNNFDTYDNAEQQNTTEYVLNTSTHKFHKASCNDVKKISPENYATASDRDQIISDGYSPCGHCNP